MSLALILLASAGAMAANPVWNNTGTDFNAGPSWDTGVAPTSATVGVFSGAANPSFLPNVTASLTVSGLDFTTTDAAGYTLSSTNGFTLSLASTVATIGSAAISGRNTSGTNTISANLGLLTTGSATQTFDQATGGTLVLGGTISGGGASTVLAIRDGGTVTFSTGNNYTGTTSLGSGSGTILSQVVNVGSNTAFGTSSLTFTTGGTTLVALGGARTLANNIQLASSNSSTIGGSNDFVLNGNISQDSSNRTLLVNNSGKTTFNGTIFLSNSATTGRTMTFGGSGAIEITGAVVDSSLAGSAQSILAYSGSGTLTLSSTTSTYTGGTNLSGGGVTNFKNNTVFSSGAVNFTGSTSWDNTSGQTLTLANAVNLSGGSMTFVGTNDLNLSSAVTMTGNSRTITVTNAGATLTLNGGIGDSGQARTLTKAGAGTLIINSGATYTGTTAVSAGTLIMNVASSATGASLTGGGVLKLNNAAALGSGTLAFGSGGGILTLGSGLTINASSNPMTASVGSTLNGAADSSLTLGSFTSLANSSQTYTVDNIALTLASIDLASSTVTINGTRSMTLNGSGTITVSGNVVVTNVNSPNSALTYAGTGILNLQGNETYGGNTIVSSGTLNTSGSITAGVSVSGGTMNASGNIGGSAAVSGGVLNLTATASSGAAVSGTGTLNVSGSGTLGGTTTLTGGTLGIGNNSAVTGTLSLTTAAGVVQSTDATAHTVGGTLSIGVAAGFGGTGNLTFTYAGNLATSGTSTLTVNNPVTQLNGMFGGTAALVKLGTGTLALAGANVNSGGTTIGAANGSNAGTLQLTGTGTIANGAVSVIAGTLDLNGVNQSITTLSMGSGSATSNGTVALGGATLTLGGDVTFLGTNNALGATISGTGAVSLNGNRNFVIGDSSNAVNDLSVSSTIQGANSLTKSGGGVLRLTGTNTFSGGLVVTSGTVSVDSFGNTGSNGPVGTAGISLGTTTTTGTLLYGGGVETTTRVITLAGTTGGGIIDSSGSGLLKFTSDIVNPGLAATDVRKTLTLQGSGTGEFAGKIVDAAAGSNLALALTKSGGGTWTLSGANSYTGLTTVTAGTLALADGVSFSTGAGVTVGSGGAGTTANLTLGTGSVLTLTGTGSTITYSGSVSNGATISGGSITSTGNRIISVADSSNATTDLTINTPMGGSVSYTKTGAGTLSLGAANGFTGGFFVGTNLGTTTNAGAGFVVLTANNAGANGLMKVVAGQIDFGNTTQTFTVAGTAVDLGAGATGSSATLLMGASGVMNLNGNLVRSVSSGQNSDTSNITGGTINLNGTTRTFTINDSTATATDLVISSIIADGSGAAGINKNTGLGTLVITGANTYSGTTTINAGTIIVGVNGVGSAVNSAFSITTGSSLGGTGTVKSITTVAGNVSPGSLTGSTGVLTSSGNVSLTTSAGHLIVDVSKGTPGAKPVAGTDYDQLATTSGTVTLTNADLVLWWSGGMQSGDVFYIISNGSGSAVSGNFASVNGTATTLAQGSNFTLSGMTFQISYNANYTGDVNTSVFSGSGNDVALQAVTVPEPATAGLVGLAALGLLRRRRSAK